MKIANKSLGKKNTKAVEFYRGGEKIELVVGPLPPKYIQRIEEAGISKYPDVPEAPVMLSPGKVLREGDRVVMKPDYKNAGFRAAATKHLEIITAATVVAGLSHDPNFQLDVQKPTSAFAASPTDWRAYFETAYAELTSEESGFTDDEIEHLIEAVRSTSLCIDIDGATQVFSQSR